MPRRKPLERGYEVSFVSGDLKQPELNQRKVDAIARVIGGYPSHEFLKAYRWLLGIHAASAATVKEATAPAISRRLERAVKTGESFHESLVDLEITDQTIFGQFARSRFFKGERYTEVYPMLRTLEQFLPVMQDALELVQKEPKRGRMPAYAEQGLAAGIAQILYEERKVMPDSRRGGVFDRLLQLAFQHADPPRPRKDVVDLMKIGLRNATVSIASG
jgi:hypothetical protein